MARSRPKVTLSVAMSIDGKIATRCGDSRLSSIADLRRVHRLRARTDAILVGRRTIIVDDPLLTVRHTRGSNPVRVIVSSAGCIPSKSRLLKTAQSIPTIVACSSKITAGRRRKLESLSVRVIVSGKNRVEPGRLLRALYADGIQTVLLEGGGETSWEFVKRGLVDEAVITVVPRLVGGAHSPTMADGEGFAGVRGSPRFRLEGVSKAGNEVVLRYSKL